MFYFFPVGVNGLWACFEIKEAWMIFPKKVRHPFRYFVMIFENQLGVVDFKFCSLNYFFWKVRTLFSGAIATAKDQGVRRALEFMRKNLQCTVSNYFTWMTQVFWIKKSNIVKTRCYVINLFFINLHMTFACIPFYQRQDPAPPLYIYTELRPEKQYRTGICLAAGRFPLTAEKHSLF